MSDLIRQMEMERRQQRATPNFYSRPEFKPIGFGTDVLGTAGGAYAAANSDLPPAQRALGGVQAAKNAYDIYSALTGAAPISGAAGGVLGALGLVPGLVDLAGSDLSTERKMAEGSKIGADAIMSYAIPYYGLAKAVQGVGQVMQGSSSPQVRAGGRALDYTAEPMGAKAFWHTILGRGSFNDAFRGESPTRAFITDAMGPIGVIGRAIGWDPTGGIFDDFDPLTFGLWRNGPSSEGGKFRQRLNAVINKTGLLGNLKVDDPDMYEMGPNSERFQTFDPAARDRAAELGATLAYIAGAKKPDYAIQAQNVLLNNLGSKVLDFTPQQLVDALRG